jgi:hypothetical protein
MSISNFTSSIRKGRRTVRAKRRPFRYAERQGTFPRLETLESRCTPSSFSVLDSFSGASLSDSTLNSGGTAVNNTQGIFVNDAAGSPRYNDSGHDANLRTGPVGQGSADANQFANTRDVSLTYLGKKNQPTGTTGEIRVQTTAGDLNYASGAKNAALLEIDYNSLPAGFVLTSGTISLNFPDLESPPGTALRVTGFINGTNIGFVDVQPSLSSEIVTLDGSAFVGQHISSMSFTFEGTPINPTTGLPPLGPDWDLAEIDASFATPAANIQITPNATNVVGASHTFTVHVNEDALGNGNFQNASNTPVTVTLTNQNGAMNVPSTPLSGVTDAAGNFQVSFSSTTAGQVIGNATATVNAGGVILMPSTDGVNGDSGPADKTFEDEVITITPNATNVVGAPHTFTATVFINRGDGNGFVVDPGAPVTITLTNQNGASANPAGPFSGITNANGQFQVTFTSATAGKVVGSATTGLTLNGSTITRTTGDGYTAVGGSDSGNTTKTFEDEFITIAPNSATNVVGAPHTFTATVFLNTGDGTGYHPFAGTNVTVSLTASNGAAPNPAGPFTGSTNASGQFSVTFASASAGKVIGQASTTLSLPNGGSITRTTGDGVGLDGGNATKFYEDEYITIAPQSATNVVGAPHTFTATVFLNSGDGTGYHPFAGTNVTVSLTASNGAAPNPAGSFTGSTNASGQFSVTFTSASAGKVIGNATTSLTTGSTTITRSTGDAIGLDSVNATKFFEDEYITIAPQSATNVVGAPHTFTATVFLNSGDGTGYHPFMGAPVTISLTASNGASPNPAGPFTGSTNASGQFSATFTSASAGEVIGNATTSLTTGGTTITRSSGDGIGLDSGNATKFFEDEYITIAPQSATNVVGAPHTFTATVFLNSGDGTGYHPFMGAPVTISLTASNGAVPNPAGPFTGSTNASGQFSATFTSASAGKVIGNATTSLTTGSTTITRSTGDAIGLDSVNATKFYEDEYITIAPHGAVNVVGNPHTFTATVFLNSGDGTGYHPFVGAPVTISLTAKNGASPNPAGPFTGSTNASGQFSATFTSATTGEVDGNATTSLTTGSTTITRSTDDGIGLDGGHAVKLFEQLTSNAGASVTLGSGNKLSDSATLTGANHPAGTITFFLFAPGVTPDGTNSNNVYKDVVTLTGAATPVTVTTSMGDNAGGFLPTVALGTGTYNWIVVYSGDGGGGTPVINNPTTGQPNDPPNPSASTSLGDEPENVTSGSYDVGVTKDDGVTTVTPGETVTYIIVVTNNPNSNVTVTNIGVSDSVPAGIASFVWSGNGHSNVSGPINDTIASLAPGASVTYTVTAMVSTNIPAGQTSIVNTVTIFPGPGDTNPNNNQATDIDGLPVQVPDCNDLFYPNGATPLTSTAFNESAVLRAASSDLSNGTFALFYNDEHALALGVRQVSTLVKGTTTLNSFNVAVNTTTGLYAGETVTGTGIATGTTIVSVGPGNSIMLSNKATASGTVTLTCTANYSVSQLLSNPGSVVNPSVGGQYMTPAQLGLNPATVTGAQLAAAQPQGNTDASGRPLFPSLYITDITGATAATLDNPQYHSGDWQYGGTPIAPDAVFGTWKAFTEVIDRTTSAVTTTLTADSDPATNNWNLGPNADTPPPGLSNEGYGAEARWDLNDLANQINPATGMPYVIPGHAYRFYVIDHDGDQNKTGGDSGQACFDFYYPGPVTNPSTLSGTVYNDVNNDGVKQASEAGIANVAVKLLDANGTLITTVYTNANGQYSFPNLPAGTSYRIVEVQPSTYNDGKDTAGTFVGAGSVVSVTNDIFKVSIGAAGNAVGTGFNFGELVLSSSATSTVSKSFTSTSIAAGNTLWFSSEFTVTGLANTGTADVHVRLVNSSITLTPKSGSPIKIAVPNALITFSSSVTDATATTTYDSTNNMWVTTVGKATASQYFLTALPFTVPATPALAGATFSWTGTFLDDSTAINVSSWAGGAAVYTGAGFPASTPFNSIGVKPVDGSTNQYPNTDKAGSPENFKAFLVAGGLGTGGTAYTGGYTSTGKPTDALIPNLTPVDPTETFQTTPVTPQLLVGRATGAAATQPALTDQSLQLVAQEAIQGWAAAGADVSKLIGDRFAVADLPNDLLGLTTNGLIQIDSNAAGMGWFTGLGDSAFNAARTDLGALAGADSLAYGSVDLLTVVSHEIGNALGFSEVGNSSVMGIGLSAGVRRFDVIPTNVVSSLPSDANTDTASVVDAIQNMGLGKTQSDSLAGSVAAGVNGRVNGDVLVATTDRSTASRDAIDWIVTTLVADGEPASGTSLETIQSRSRQSEMPPDLAIDDRGAWQGGEVSSGSSEESVHGSNAQAVDAIDVVFADPDGLDQEFGG